MEQVKLESTLGQILCCGCGVLIEHNPTNQCLACLRNKNDITENIPKSGMLQFCSGCERYYEPPSAWICAQLESKELLRICLKKLKTLSEVKLVDARFLWTEPHSKRIKMKVVVQKEITEGAVLQQDFVAEFCVQHLMCSDCHRVEAKDYWSALVQVRQKTHHKRTFYYLEQLILKHKVHEKALGIKTERGGLNFFFTHEQNGVHLLEFLRSVVPCRWTRAKKLKSQDIHSNTFNYKHTFSVEIVPVCKDSVVCLPRKLAQQLGGISQICIIQRITNHIALIDPTTAQMAELSADVYWRTPFNEICTSKKLTQFVVMDMEETNVRTFAGQGPISTKHTVGDMWVQRVEDVGKGDPIFCRSHLAHLLEIGDNVFGFDMNNSNVNNEALDKLKPDEIPSIILVRKLYANKAYRNKRRQWKLRHLDLDDDMNSQNADYMEFLDDIEEDPSLRPGMNIIMAPDRACPVDPELEGENIPTIGIEEMIKDLDVEAETVQEGETIADETVQEGATIADETVQEGATSTVSQETAMES